LNHPKTVAGLEADEGHGGPLWLLYFSAPNTSEALSMISTRPLIWVGVAGFEPTASSSRSNLGTLTACGITWVELGEQSPNVRGRTRKYGAVVAQLDTQGGAQHLPRSTPALISSVGATGGPAADDCGDVPKAAAPRRCAPWMLPSLRFRVDRPARPRGVSNACARSDLSSALRGSP
ncbi:MAG: hypothetical protein JWO67_4543, partial [Streptosporangiaceae bacterium]|nr:hypothetical protein [Streptosporangiaceae bacterium]